MVGPFNEYYQHQQEYPYYNNNNYNYNNGGLCYDDDETDYMYSSSSSTSSYSSVDCTLSLGTPSTRLTNNTTTPTPHRNSVSSFCWDLLHPNKQSNSNSKSSSSSSSRGGGNANDPLFVRRCANCDTTSTPLWRNGPRGPKSLCNACGIRFKKEERRAAAASTTAANNNVPTNGVMDPHHGYYNGSSWGQQYNQTTPQKMQCYGTPNEFMFMEDQRTSSETTGIQFLSWLTHDRPTALLHDFTR